MPLLLKVLALVLSQAAAPRPPPPPAPELRPAPGYPTVLASGLPPLPPELVRRVLQYGQTRSATLYDVSEDGQRLLIGTRFGRTEQLHRVSQPLGMREQLTFLEEPVGQAAFLPGDPLTLFFLEDTGGGELYQLERLDLRTGHAERLTDGKSRHESFVLSRDGRWIAYSGTGRNGKDADVYLAEVADAHNPRRLTELEGSWLPLEFSPDGKHLLVGLRGGALAFTDVTLVEVSSGARRALLPRLGHPRVRQALFSPDGKGVYLVTDAEGPYASLRYLDVGSPDAVLESVGVELPWNVERAAVARDGAVAFSTNEDGYSRLYLLRGRRVQPLPLPAGVLDALRFPRDRSDVVLFSLQSPTSPTDVWQLSLKTKKLTRWTKSEVGGLDSRNFVTPALVRYPAADGVQVPALLYRPREVAKGARVPVVVYWHGGPERQERPDFHPEFQLLLEQGLAVLAPNVRGSEGYGKAYRAADDGVARAQVLKDIAATLQWLAVQPDLDASRVAAYGEGYGGYLALASVAFYPGAFRAAVEVAGIPHLVHFLENTEAYFRDARRMEYGDERLPEVRAVLDAISPLAAVENIQAALLVVAGKRDARVPQREVEQLVQGVRSRGQEVWYLLALDEGHGLRRRESRELATMALVLFLQQTLAVRAAGPAPSGR
jgi:dipeptidyl aminopeptidase/acylaminoacyl peptidase